MKSDVTRHNVTVVGRKYCELWGSHDRSGRRTTHTTVKLHLEHPPVSHELRRSRNVP